jgi:DNA-directed RNA polymerase subunit H (RpoH/RPB5)
MHVLQPKHFKLKKEEVDKMLKHYNIALGQLPKISKKDPMLSEDFSVGDVVKIERKTDEGIQEYFRVVV